MIVPEKKKAIGVILSKMNSEGGYEDGATVKNEVAADVRNSALHSHAQDVFNAIHNKSPAEFVSAMKNFLDEHELHQEKEGEEPSDYEPKK